VEKIRNDDMGEQVRELTEDELVNISGASVDGRPSPDIAPAVLDDTGKGAPHPSGSPHSFPGPLSIAFLR
jgi:hypothetical protein